MVACDCLPQAGQAHCLIADTREPGGKAAQGLFISFPKTRRRGKGSGSPIDERVSLFPIIRLHGGIATSGEMRDAPRSPSAQEIAIFSQLPVSGRQSGPTYAKRFRSEESRVGKEGVRTCRSRWAQIP